MDRHEYLREWESACRHILFWSVAMLIAGRGPSQANSEEPRAGAGGLTTAVTVELFQLTDSVPTGWNPEQFADSLVARLRLMKGLSARRTGDTMVASPTDFSLRGEVATQNGRLVLAARLWHVGDPAPAWTATFWRSETAIHSLVDELARGAAEALYAEIVRRSVSGRKELTP